MRLMQLYIIPYLSGIYRLRLGSGAGTIARSRWSHPNWALVASLNSGDVGERGGKGGSEAASINSGATVLCTAEPEPLGVVPNGAIVASHCCFV